MRLRLPLVLSVVLGLTLLAATSCSTKKNTGASRFWQSFTAKYNTYYNGAMAYIDGSLEKEQGNQDNYTELIPLYYVGNKNSVSLGEGNFDRAIEKAEKAIKLHSIKRRPAWTKKRRKTERDIEWLNRREYNPMMWKAWMLLGRSQFHKGDFDGAAATFSYMSRLYATQPAIYGKARAWLAKAYVESGWLYDAEDVIRNMSRDSIHWSAQKEWNYTYADYYIHAGDYERAIPYLQQVIRREGRHKQKAREHFLLGQLYALTGNTAEAYKSYKRVIRQHPPYELQFNAHIAMTEVLAQGNVKRMIGKLKRMARSDNNADYLDQVYYAMGNIYLTQHDTLSAIYAYEKGNEKSTRNGVEKGMLLLRLGDLYWDTEKFSDASRCYGEAIGLLDKDRPGYTLLAERSEKLDQLVPYTEAIHLQDSLQALAQMSEEERNAAIDRVIEALKKKEKEEKDAAARAAAEETIARNSQNTGRQQTTVSDNTTVNGTWYFYNAQAVSQGKTAFQRQWGRRDNVDHWQRTNRTVVNFTNDDEDDYDTLTDEQRDSLLLAEEAAAALEASKDSAVNDPHQREYYLAQIPFTDEQKAASDLTIMDALYHSGVIFKDKLDKLPQAERQLLRLTKQYPTYEGMDNAYYHLFLLYSRLGLPAVATGYVVLLQQQYPFSAWTALLSDPYFADNQRFGKHIEDSLYAATYDAFKGDRYGEIRTNVRLSHDRFPLGANRDKFVFIGGLGKLNSGDAIGCIEDMTTVVTDFPDSDVAELAGMILNGVRQGRQLQGGHFALGDIWARRSMLLNEEDSLAARELSADPDGTYYFLIAYERDSVDTNRLLYQLARFNFTTYLVRNFDIALRGQEALNIITLSGFNSYYEAHEYAQAFSRQEAIHTLLGASCRTFIISEENLSLLGTRYSYDDYDAFYAEHFIPLQPSGEPLLTEPSTARSALDDGGSLPGNISAILLQEESPLPDDEGYLMDDEERGIANEDIYLIEDEAAAPANEDIYLIEDEGETPTNEEIYLIEEEGENPANEDIIIIEDEGETPANEDIYLIEDEAAAPANEDIIIIEEEAAAPANEDIIIIEDEAAAPANEDIIIIEEEAAAPANEDIIIIEDEDYDADDGLSLDLEDYDLDEEDWGADDEYYDLDGF